MGLQEVFRRHVPHAPGFLLTSAAFFEWWSRTQREQRGIPHKAMASTMAHVSWSKMPSELASGVAFRPSGSAG